MNAYIDYVGKIQVGRRPLNDNDLREIGKFTRENVSRSLKKHPHDLHGIVLEDIHAVCGDNSGLRDMDIPWATERGKQIFQRVYHEHKP